MLDKIRKEDPKLILAMMRSGMNRKRTVRSSGGFWSTEGIDGGLILLMRLPCGTITVARGLLIWTTLKLRMRHLSGKCNRRTRLECSSRGVKRR